MKGKFLIVFCLLVSMSAMGQGRKSSASSSHQANAIATDSLPGQDTSKEKLEEITADEVDNFCPVLSQLMTDAAGNFERIRGKSIETVANNTRYISMGGVPGAVTSCLIHSPSKWQYEGVLYQGNSPEELQTVIDKYKRSLDNCLPGKGYTLSTGKASTPKPDKPDSYPEYIYAKADDKNSPRATLKVEYTAGADIYVLTLNVWNN